MPYPRYLTVLCQPYIGGEGCRNAGQSGDHDTPNSNRLWDDVNEKKEHHGWFDIRWKDDHSYIHPFVYASRQELVNVEIRQAVAFALSSPDDVTNFMKTLDGKRATIWLGLNDATQPILTDDYTLLTCREFWFEEVKGVYGSDCYSNKWASRVTFNVPDAASKQTLDRLNASIKEVISSVKNDHMLYQIMVYPFFVYSFLVLSALTWITAKAVRYVKKG